MEIRLLSEKDNLNDVNNVYEQSWKYAYKDIIPQIFLDSIPVGKWTTSIQAQDRHNLVAVDQDHIIGTLSFCKSRWKNYKDYGEIVSLYLLPEYMGKGYGKELLESALNELTTQGFNHILLWVIDENVGARRFYEKQGFTYQNIYLTENIGGKDIRELMYMRR